MRRKKVAPVYWTPARIRELREDILGWSREAFALHLRVCWHTIRRWESGETQKLRRRDIEELDKLAGRRRRIETPI